MDDDDLDFRKDSQFDKYELDVAAEEQASLYGRWAKEFVDSEYEVKQIERRIKKLESKHYLYVTKNWKDLDTFDKKPTDKGIEHWTVQQEDYQNLQDELLEAMRICNAMKEAKRSMEHRKKMIEVEKDLYVNSFWAKPEMSMNPKVKKEITEIKRDDRNRETSKRVTERMTQRRSRTND
jgi:hypothetical protein